MLPNGTPAYSEAIADAVDAVVLPPLHPLPAIPKTPRYESLDALADALEESVGCARRQKSRDALLCGTEQATTTTCPPTS
ncbi:hypothetical protein ABZ023_20220 [Streptomyces sp. NPDC006367]|uniref:hypothetical protein n=1 Tax=unclassified Streptomyces TaxID=2593676 RepID=UPI0033AF6EDB